MFNWRMHLFGMLTNGARNMISCFTNIMTQLQKTLHYNYKLICIQCRVYQLDLFIEHIINVVVYEHFFFVMIGIILYLMQQQNFIVKMNIICPYIVNRWLSTNKVTTWFKKYRLKLLTYIQMKEPTSILPWLQQIYLPIMDTFIEYKAWMFHKIQGLTTRILQEEANLKAFVSHFIEDLRSIGLLTNKMILSLDLTMHVMSSCYVVSLFNEHKFFLLISHLE